MENKNADTEKKYKAIPAFSDHKNCKGHGNFMLDSTLETEEERNALIMALNNYIPKNVPNKTDTNKTA